MPFDASTARPVNPDNAGEGFNPSTAKVVEMKDTVVFDADSSSVISLPGNLNAREQPYVKAVDIDKKPSEGFIGFVNAGIDSIKSTAKGLGHFVASTPQLFGGLSKELGENLEAGLRKNKDLLGQGFKDVFDQELTAGDLFTAIAWPVQVPTFFAEKFLLEGIKLPQKIAKSGDRLIKANRNWIRRKGLIRPEGKLNGFFFDLGSGIGSVGTAIGVTMVTRKPAIAAAYFGLLQKTSTYVEAREKGFEPGEAKDISTLAGVSEAALEFVGNSIFLKLAGKSSRVLRILGRAGEEALQEASQTAAEEVILQTAGVREVDPRGAVGRIAYSALLGAIIGAPVATVTEFMSKVAEEEGVSDELAVKIKEKVDEAMPDIEEELSKSIAELTDGITEDPKNEARVKDIVSQFERGQNINVDAEIDGIDFELPTLEEVAIETERKAKAKEIVGLRQAFVDEKAKEKNRVDRRIIRSAKASEKKADVRSKKRPLVKFLIKQGGIAPGSRIASELANVGITQKTHPSLFREGKLKSLDNIPASDLAVETGVDLSQIERDGINVSQDFLIKSLADEVAGRPAFLPFGEISETQLLGDQLVSFLEEQGVDIATATNEEIDEAVFGVEALPKKKTAPQLAREVLSAKISGVRKSFRSFKQGLRVGRRSASQEITEQVDTLIKIINEHLSGTTERRAVAKDLFPLVKKITKAQNPNLALVKILPVIQERIERAVERIERNKSKDKLFTLLKKTEVKKGKGKFTPDIQDVLEVLSLRKDAATGTKMRPPNVGEAERMLEQNLQEDMGTFSAVQALQNKMLAIRAGSSSITLEDIQEMVSTVEAIIEEGKTGRLLREFIRDKTIADLTEEVEKAALAGEDIELIDRAAMKTKMLKSLNVARGSANWMFNGWFDTMDITLGQTKGSEVIVNKLGFMASRAFQKVKGRAFDMSEEFQDMAVSTLGLKNRRQLVKRVTADAEVVPIGTGTYKNARGKEVPFRLSRAEARKRWMEIQDPTLLESITSEKGNAYTPAMVEALDEFLTKQDKDFALGQLQFYRDFYKEINKVYSRMYGVNLPFNEFYSPIRRDVGPKEVSDSFLREIGYRRSIIKGSLKERVRNFNPIKEQSDITVMLSHIMEMSHFIEFAETAQTLNGVFNNQQVREAIKTRFGNAIMGTIDGFLDDFSRGHIDRARAFTGITDALLRNFTLSQLGLKAAIGLKQMVSFLTYAAFIPAQNFATGTISFIANPKKSMRVLNKSNLLRTRGQTLTSALAGVAAEEQSKVLTKKRQLSDMLMFFTRGGDRSAIATGGNSVVLYNRDVLGKSEEEALEALDDITALTQQSSDLDQLSGLQRRGGLAKLFVRFMSSQNAYLRREIAAFRNLSRDISNKRTTKSEALKKFTKQMAIYHFILPVLFQFTTNVFNLFGDDDEEAFRLKRAAILGSFNGFFIFYDALSATVSLMLGRTDEFWLQKDGQLLITQFITDIALGMAEVIDEITVDDIWGSIEDIAGSEAPRHLGRGFGKISGLPLEQLLNATEGILDISNDEAGKGAAKILGWPRGATED